MAAIARRAWIIRLVLPPAMGSEQPPPPISIHAGGSASSRGRSWIAPVPCALAAHFFRTWFSSRHARSRACATVRYRYLEREQTESETFSEELKEHFLIGTPCLVGLPSEIHRFYRNDPQCVSDCGPRGARSFNFEGIERRTSFPHAHQDGCLVLQWPSRVGCQGREPPLKRP